MSLKTKLFSCLVLLNTQFTFAQSPDSIKTQKEDYTFIGLMPSFAGIVTFGQPQEFADVLIPGINFSIGKTRNKWVFGAVMGYRHYFIENQKDANEYNVGSFAEHHFNPGKKATWMLGLKPYLLIWQYTPQSNRFRFFNDPLDGKSRTYFIPAVLPYVGGDFKIKKRYHLVVGAGYDFKFTTRSGIVPFGSPFNLIFDFRIPIRKR